MNNEKQKSTGVFILGVIGMFISVISLGIFIYMHKTYPNVYTIRLMSLIGFYTLLMFIPFCGLIFYKNWARKFLIILFSMRIVESVIKAINYVINDLSQLKLIHFLEQSVNILFFSLLIYFLCRKSIRNQFD